jgi:hypothetical protein
MGVEHVIRMGEIRNTIDTKFQLENVKGRYFLEDSGVDGKTTSKGM